MTGLHRRLQALGLLAYALTARLCCLVTFQVRGLSGNLSLVPGEWEVLLVRAEGPRGAHLQPAPQESSRRSTPGISPPPSPLVTVWVPGR